MSETTEREKILSVLEDVQELLYDVVDPELGVNIVDLGLVYNIGYDTEKDMVIINMTLTSPACPLTDVLENDIAAALQYVDGFDTYEISWVWSPPWSMSKVTQDGRDQLRALGFNM